MCMHPAAASSKMTRQTLPWVPLIVSLFACFGDAVVAIMLYPMLPYMVQDFGIPRDQVGFYVGMLGTCYNLLQVPASAFWGKMSDIFGRKRVLMTGQLTLMTATACLGLSSSFGAALAARCLAGALNGNNAVTRAALRDITLPSQRARAFSLFGLMLSVAFGIAPLFGSFLARPIDAFPSLKGTFLEEYPYLLPCIVADAMVLAGLVGLCWFPADPASYVARFTQHTVEPLVLEDGSESRQNSGGDGGGDAGGGDDGGDGDGDGDGGNINAAEHRRRCRTQPSLRAPLLDGSSPACTHSQSSCACADARVSAEAPSAVAIRMPPSDVTDAAQAPGTSTHNARDTHKDTHKDTHTPHTTNSAHTTNAERAGQALDAPSAAASCTISSPSSTADAGSGDLKQSGTDATAAIAVRRHGFFFLCVGNGFFGVLVAGGAELFPLFAAADSPGLDISPSQLGLSLTPAAAGLIAGSCAFPWIHKRLGATGSFVASCAIFLAVNVCMPQLRWVESESQKAMWTAIIIISLVRGVSGPIGFPALAILINNSLSKDIGLWNGVASACMSAGRAAAPAAVGSLWALTLSHPRWHYPGDYHLAFYAMAAAAAVCIVCARYFPLPVAEVKGHG